MSAPPPSSMPRRRKASAADGAVRTSANPDARSKDCSEFREFATSSTIKMLIFFPCPDTHWQNPCRLLRVVVAAIPQGLAQG
jgi:hypothetical protein